MALAGAAAGIAAVGAVPGEALAASEACTAPTTTVVDGYQGSRFLRLTAQRNPADSRTTWICFRVRENGQFDRGGRIDVTDATVSPTLPSVDGDSTACTTTTPNFFPGPRPLVTGQVGSQTEPPYVPFFLDAYLAPFHLWTCLRVGDVNARLKIATSGFAPPVVNVTEDGPNTTLPVRGSGPAGYPSSRCMEQGGYVRLANMTIGDANVWALIGPDGTEGAAACLRVERPGQKAVGYRVFIHHNNTPGVAPVVQQSTDTTPCTEPVVALGQPVQVKLARSPRGANPASVCVEAGATKQRITVGTTGAPTVPEAGILKDPDSV